MEQPIQHNDEQAQDLTARPEASLGSMLREARERQGLSVGDVANQIKFAPRQIEALEADDFSATLETAFLRGFVRSYGKLLQLDVGTLFAALPETKVTMLSAASTSNELSFPNAQTARQQNLIWLGAALVFVVIALGFAITNLNAPAKPEKEVVVETAVVLPSDMAVVAEQAFEPAASAVQQTAPVVEAVPQTETKTAVNVEAKQPEVKPVAVSQVSIKKPMTSAEKTKPISATQATTQASAAKEIAPTKAVIPIDTLLGTQPAKPVTDAKGNTASAGLRIVFGHESWTEIKDKNGKILSSQVNASGSELRLEGHAPFTMLIGHAQSARLYYKGKQVDLKPYINSTSEVAHVTLE